jgi:hypothetical protein
MTKLERAYPVTVVSRVVILQDDITSVQDDLREGIAALQAVGDMSPEVAAQYRGMAYFTNPDPLTPPLSVPNTPVSVDLPGVCGYLWQQNRMWKYHQDVRRQRRARRS